MRKNLYTVVQTMTDEELETADDLIRETITQIESEGRLSDALTLVGHRSIIHREAKARISRAMEARAHR